MSIKKLSYETLVLEAVESGHSPDEASARTKILETIQTSFLTKCAEQKIELDNQKVTLIVGCSKKYDCFFVMFKEVFFEVYLNDELLFADLDPHVFVHVKMPEKIDELKEICKIRRPDVPLKVNYFKPIGRKYLN